MKFKALSLSLLLFFPVGVAANEKPMITVEAAKRITLNGLTKYSIVYCEQREEGVTHKKADAIAFDEAYNFMSLSAYQYRRGNEAIFQREIIQPMLLAMENLAKRRCPKYFSSL